MPSKSFTTTSSTAPTAEPKLAPSLSSPPKLCCRGQRSHQYLVDQAARYHFLKPLEPIAERLSKLAEKDYTYLLNNLTEFQDDLLTAKDDLLSPIKAFMHGPQRVAYDEAIAFLREEEANFAELPSAEVQPLAISQRRHIPIAATRARREDRRDKTAWPARRAVENGARAGRLYP